MMQANESINIYLTYHAHVSQCPSEVLTVVKSALAAMHLRELESGCVLHLSCFPHHYDEVSAMDIQYSLCQRRLTFIFWKPQPRAARDCNHECEARG